jgi:phosphate transport system protein
MPRQEYQAALDDLRADVHSMGELVLDQLSKGITALETADEHLAREVIAGDSTVDRQYLELESDCIDLIALQQPVAGDLRFIAGSFKVITDLERIGDLATNLARYSISATASDLPEEDLRPIGEKASALVGDALDAYVAEDGEAARGIAERDDEVDTLCHTASDRVVREVIRRGSGDGRPGEGDPWDVESLLDDVTRVLLSIRDLERVADHGVNIAARTLYVVEADPVLI